MATKKEKMAEKLNATLSNASEVESMISAPAANESANESANEVAPSVEEEAASAVDEESTDALYHEDTMHPNKKMAIQKGLDFVATSFKLPRELHDCIKYLASMNGESKNKYIIDVLTAVCYTPEVREALKEEQTRKDKIRQSIENKKAALVAAAKQS